MCGIRLNRSGKHVPNDPNCRAQNDNAIIFSLKQTDTSLWHQLYDISECAISKATFIEEISRYYKTVSVLVHK